MKKSLCLFIAVLAFALQAWSQNTKDNVVIGQIYYTWNHGNQEVLKGKVKSLSQKHYWAKEENGKIVKGEPITAPDRKTTPLGNDFTEQYNKLGIVTRNTTFVDGKVTQDVTVESKGKNLLKTTYYTNGTLLGYGKYTNKGGRPVFLQGISPNDTVFSNFSYEYDPSGRIVKFTSMNYKSEPTNSSIKIWNEKGNLLSEKVISSENKLFVQFDYTYDEKGNRISHHQITQDGRVIDYTFKYEYDGKGNYTAIIMMKDGKPFIYRERVIEYFE